MFPSAYEHTSKYTLMVWVRQIILEFPFYWLWSIGPNGFAFFGVGLFGITLHYNTTITQTLAPQITVSHQLSLNVYSSLPTLKGGLTAAQVICNTMSTLDVRHRSYPMQVECKVIKAQWDWNTGITHNGWYKHSNVDASSVSILLWTV